MIGKELKTAFTLLAIGALIYAYKIDPSLVSRMAKKTLDLLNDMTTDCELSDIENAKANEKYELIPSILKKRREYPNLKTRLRFALEEERYEDAAKIRDSIIRNGR